MYLRKNTVRCGDTRRTYLSISHNVWLPPRGERRGGSRPVCVVSFGRADRVDDELAREMVTVLERCAPRLTSAKGEGRRETMRIAREVRRIEPFLRRLVSRELGLGRQLPEGPQRVEILEALVRSKLAAPDIEPSLDHLLAEPALATG